MNREKAIEAALKIALAANELLAALDAETKTQKPERKPSLSLAEKTGTETLLSMLKLKKRFGRMPDSKDIANDLGLELSGALYRLKNMEARGLIARPVGSSSWYKASVTAEGDALLAKSRALNGGAP